MYYLLRVFKKPPSHLMGCESREPVSFICTDAPKARYSQYQDQLRRVHEDASGCKLLCRRIEAEQVGGMSWGPGGEDVGIRGIGRTISWSSSSISISVE